MSYTNLTGEFPYRALLTQFKMNALAANDHYFYTSLAQGGNADLLHSHSFQKLEEIKNNSPITISSKVDINGNIFYRNDYNYGNSLFMGNNLFMSVNNIYTDGKVDGLYLDSHNHDGVDGRGVKISLENTLGFLDGSKISDNTIPVYKLKIATQSIGWSIFSSDPVSNHYTFVVWQLGSYLFYPYWEIDLSSGSSMVVELKMANIAQTIDSGKRATIDIAYSAKSGAGIITTYFNYLTGSSPHQWCYLLKRGNDIINGWYSYEHPSMGMGIHHPFVNNLENDEIILLDNELLNKLKIKTIREVMTGIRDNKFEIRYVDSKRFKTRLIVSKDINREITQLPDGLQYAILMEK